MGKTLRSLLAPVLVGFATAATGTVINFTYTSTSDGCSPNGCTDEQIGSFAFADSPLSVDLADLTAFSLTATVTGAGPVPAIVSYGLTDLESFSATLDAAQNLLTLSFKTDEVSADFFGTSSVVFTSTSPASAAVEHCFTDDTKDGPRERCFLATTGTLITTSSSVPEPSIIPLLVIGLGMAGFGFGGIAYERMKGRRAWRTLT